MLKEINEAVDFIKSKSDVKAQFGIILGTGLGALAAEIEVVDTISYEDIPNFPVSTVESHSGRLLLGTLEGKNVVVMQGRFHYYEGYSMKQVTFPVRVMKFLGIETLIVSNVSGSTNAEIEAGEIVLIKDHINLHPENPLLGPNDSRLGVRFPDMSNIYDGLLREKAMRIAARNNIKVHEGVYVSLSGPNLETLAEYNFLNAIGGDLVGMSTVPEVIVARHSSLKVFAISSGVMFPVVRSQSKTGGNVQRLASTSTVTPSGKMRGIFSTNPPPVIWLSPLIQSAFSAARQLFT